MTVGECIDRVSGWNYIRVCKGYENEAGNPVCETIFTNETGYEDVPFDIIALEVSEIRAEQNTVVLTCEE